MKTSNGNHVVDYGLDRQMPGSADCERAILGAVLLDNSCWFQTEVLQSEDFHLDSHRRIYRAMNELMDAGKPIDFVTITEQIGWHKEIESVGGVAYVTSLTDGLPRVKNIEQYVKIVKDKSILRKAIHVAHELIENCYNQDTDAESIIVEADKKLLQIQSNQKTGGPRLASDFIMEVEAEYERVRSLDKNVKAIGYPTGHDGLDREILGYHKGELVTIAAETSGGKSVLMRQGIHANIMQDKPCGVFTFEVLGRPFITNMLSPLSNISPAKLRDFRQLDDMPSVLGKKSEAEVFKAHLHSVKNWKVWIESNSRNSHVDNVCSSSRMLIRNHGVETIWIDHYHLLQGSGQNQTEREEYIADCLVSLSRTENVPVIVLAQFSKDKDRQSANRPPQRGDIRGAKKLEEHAATEIFIWTDKNGKDYFVIPKQRNGMRGMYPVHLDTSILWFEDGHR